MNLIGQVIDDRQQRDGTRKLHIAFLDSDASNQEVKRKVLRVRGDTTQEQINTRLPTLATKLQRTLEDEELGYYEKNLEKDGIDNTAPPKINTPAKVRRHLVKRIFNNVAEGKIYPDMLGKIYRGRKLLNKLNAAQVANIMGWTEPQAQAAIDKVRDFVQAVNRLDHGLGIVEEETNLKRTQRTLEDRRYGDA